VKWRQHPDKPHVWRACVPEHVHVYSIPEGWTVYTPSISGGVYATREAAQLQAERWLAVQRGQIPHVLRVARDEWPAVSWSEYDAWGGPLSRASGWLVPSGGGSCVGVLVERAAGGWCAAVTWRGYDGRMYWRPRATHRTARAALRELRYSLRWSLAAVLRDLALDPDRIRWRYVEDVARLAREHCDD